MFVKSAVVPGLVAIFSATCFGFVVNQDADEKTKNAERAAVERACLDYVEGIYDVKPEMIKRSVHPELKKFGFARTNDGYRGIPMNFEQLVSLAGKWNKDGRAGENPPKKVGDL